MNASLGPIASIAAGVCLAWLSSVVPSEATDQTRAANGPATTRPAPAGIRLARYERAADQQVYYNYGLRILPPWDDGGFLFINFPEHLEYMPGTRGILRYSDQDPKGHWEVAADGLTARLDVESVTEPGVRVVGEAKVAGPDRIEVTMTIVNGSRKRLGDIRPLYCFQYRDLTGFPRWVDNFKHTFFVRDGKLTALADIKTPKDDAEVKAGSVKDTPQKNDSEFAVKYGGWIDRGVDASVCAVTSLDERRTLIVAWTPGKSAFSNAGIPCAHADPFYGTIEPGKSARAKGLIILSEQDKGALVKDLLAQGIGAAALAPAATALTAPATTTAAAADGDLGIAARYVMDRGIERDPDVLFADDFEAWTDDGTKPPPNGWSVHRNKTSRTQTVPGSATPAGQSGPGNRVLEIACWTEGTGSQVGGLSRKLGNYNHAKEGLGDGHDELNIRWYQKFDETYRGVANHGGNLGGRDLTRPNAAWVGQAAIRDIASRGYFYSGVQPYGKRGSPEVEMGFYSYHLDKKGPWGENYAVQKKLPLRVGAWHCIERHMKLNSVDPQTGEARADGVEELWVDGQLTIRKPDVRFRKTPGLRITFFTLETYYHGLPKEFDAARPIKVHYDNLVIARRYIGPMSHEQP